MSEQARQLEVLARHDRLERHAGTRSIGDELAAVVRVHVVDGADVRVAQEGDGRGFAGESPDRIRDRLPARPEGTSAHLPRQLEVLGVVHDAHAPVPSLPVMR
jgi:hypothetical protein